MEHPGLMEISTMVNNYSLIWPISFVVECCKGEILIKSNPTSSTTSTTSTSTTSTGKKTNVSKWVEDEILTKFYPAVKSC